MNKSIMLKNDFKLVGKEIVYYYNKNLKLWSETELICYESFMYSFFNTLKNIKKLIKIMNEIDVTNKN